LYEYKAITTRVVDGDTIDVDIDLGFEVHVHTRLRLAGIDAPEMRGKEKKEGKKAKAFLEELLFDVDMVLNEGGDEDEVRWAKHLIIQTHKDRPKGKYGRWIAWIYLEEEYGKVAETPKGEWPKTDNERTINGKMVAAGHAVWSK
jgi:micrococcal nuclease